MVETQFKENPYDIFYRCVEDCSEAIMITNNKGALVYVNPAWEKIYGFSKDEAIGNSPNLLHSGVQPKEFYRRMWEEIGNPRVGYWKGEVINKAKDGRLIPVLLTITPFKEKKGEITGYMGIAVDISQQKQLEAQVLRQDRLASVGVLASGLAHEVGTPLGVIRGRAEFLKEFAGGNETLTRGFDIIIQQIDRISKLISSLLSFSRSEGEVRVKAIPLRRILEEVFELLEDKFRRSQVVSVLDIPTDLLVLGDSSRLQQVFINLLINAVQAMDKKTDRERKIRVSVESASYFHHIRIEDTGCGISPENMHKLFQPFFTTKDIGEGTGLGLAIVAKLINEMGGDIDVASIEGQGTTFTVMLKRA